MVNGVGIASRRRQSEQLCVKTSRNLVRFTILTLSRHQLLACFSSPIQASNTQPATGPLPSCAHLYTFDILQPQIYPESSKAPLFAEV